ncbi:MAG: hypothetical protein LKI80_02900 [Sporolactobacillus sp.]|jgi:hypothetical protein|nr:hypothetical protein [Sporolactobacillus sp.]
MPINRTHVLLLLLFSIVLWWVAPQAAEAAPPKRPIVQQRPIDVQQMAATSDVVAVVRLNAQITRWDTGVRLGGRRTLVNAAQKLSVLRMLNGRLTADALLLTTVVQPLPPPRDPLNRIYTGPLADGEYVLFLQACPENPYYRLNGGFSAVYPLFNGRTIALEPDGFPELGQRTPEEIRQMIVQES